MFSLPPATLSSSGYFQGLPYVVETPKYGIRSGKTWMNVSPTDYGYICGFEGADGDDIDCYIGPDPESRVVYVVDQNKIESSNFDEHKCMLGYSSQSAALIDYMAGHTEGYKIFRAITPLNIDKFKEWLCDGNLKKPISEQKL